LGRLWRSWAVGGPSWSDLARPIALPGVEFNVSTHTEVM
jgi:hypothetical protein